MAEQFANAHAWASVVHRSDRGHRMSGGGVMDSFADGLKYLRVPEWDLLVKLDADVTFESDYFERCMTQFDNDPQLGIGGGQICVLRDGCPVVECPGDPSFHVRGATKIYRHACWNQIGGLVQSTGWDTIDELMANQHGWHTYTFKEIPLIQHRETGKAEPLWRDYVKNGRANYLTGYHPLFMLLKCAKRMAGDFKPLNALGLAWGYCGLWSRRTPRPVDRTFVKYLQSEQWKLLLGRNSIWKNTPLPPPA